VGVQEGADAFDGVRTDDDVGVHEEKRPGICEGGAGIAGAGRPGTEGDVGDARVRRQSLQVQFGDGDIGDDDEFIGWRGERGDGIQGGAGAVERAVDRHDECHRVRRLGMERDDVAGRGVCVGGGGHRTGTTRA